MENSKLYTATEIDKLKQKVVAYKNLLTTLKLGASLEDYLFIKNEFEELKMKMSHVETLKDDVDKNQFEQAENNRKQVSVQLDSLNQMVEEVLATLNKVVVGEEKKEQAEQITSPRKIIQVDEAKSHDKPVDNVISQPTYSQLKNLAGQVMYHQKNEEPIQTIQSNNYPVDAEHEQRHFNHRYFQSLNTQPSNIHNGLYRNMHIKASSQLEDAVQRPKRGNSIINELEAPALLPNALDRSNIQPFISTERQHTNIYIDKFNGAILGPAEQLLSSANTPQQVEQPTVSTVTPQQVEQPPSLKNTPQSVEQPTVPTVTPQQVEQPSASAITPQQTEQLQPPPVTSEQIEQLPDSVVTSEQTEQQSEPIIQSEETLSSEAEKKKQKSSSFFGFFRK